MTGLHDARVGLANAAVPRHDLRAVEDHDLVVSEKNLDAPTNEAMRCRAEVVYTTTRLLRIAGAAYRFND
jgi:hypothetical protein